ncbi:cobalt-precorrin-6A reductase [Gordonia sp. CPCC 206044]|uniref:cobalt-precorrin-6A reductase n=1 Tax=Gordonia sp. CPCC 206044 TaxID=3140793 RepID=UPI003AF3CD63
MSAPDPDGPVLILGGTGEARALAARLVEAGVPTLSSLAGRVQQPRLPVGEVRIGGFGGVDGLADWIVAHRVRAIVDATHPFAATITRNAASAAERTARPLLRLRRPAWTPGPGDRWDRVADMADAAAAVRARTAANPRVFVTTGRQDVGVFADIDDAWFLIRVVDPPTGALPAHHRVLRSRGPHDLESERTILRDNGIDILVTKNSGGDLTHAKLVAAAELEVAVIMVDRSVEPVVGDAVSTVDEALAWLAGSQPSWWRGV